MNETWLYSFETGDKSDKGLLGGKGANLANMTQLGLPVPPGCTITTEACNAYTDTGVFPEGLKKKLSRWLDLNVAKAGGLQSPPATGSPLRYERLKG